MATTRPLALARDTLSRLVTTVFTRHNRVILEKQGIPVAAIVPMEDFEQLEALDAKQPKETTR